MHPIYRKKASEQEMFSLGTIHLSTDAIHTVKPLEADIPKRETYSGDRCLRFRENDIDTGKSDSGIRVDDKWNKTSLSCEKNITAEDIEQVKLIDAAPIGINVRSTVATYANVHDELRKVYAKLPDAKEAGYKAGDFFLQYRKTALPDLRWNRFYQP